MFIKGDLILDFRLDYFKIKEKKEQNNVIIIIKVYQKEIG